MKYSIAIAGTTLKTKQCAQSLLESNLFTIAFIVTPVAKPAGRKQIVTPNPMEVFAKKNDIVTLFVANKIDQIVKENVLKLPRPDFLLVVDFGYIIPPWLLKVPKISPLNIHPSELPKWRGSSPGQFALLFNEIKSAITLMVMNEKLDQGAIIHQDFFSIEPSWNHTQYYEHAFNIMCENLDQKIIQFAKDPKLVQPQPENSPTITARTIKKEQAFIPWNYLKMALQGQHPTDKDITELSPLLQTAYKANGSFAQTIERATKAFSPWPNVWTIIPTNKGEKRMKLLEVELLESSDTQNQNSNDRDRNNKSALEKNSSNSTEKKLQLVTVHIEGKNPSKWEEVKNCLRENQ